MSKKSSKTSHVLNLLTNRIGTVEPDEVQEQPQAPSEESQSIQKEETELLQSDSSGEEDSPHFEPRLPQTNSESEQELPRDSFPQNNLPPENISIQATIHVQPDAEKQLPLQSAPLEKEIPLPENLEAQLAQSLSQADVMEREKPASENTTPSETPSFSLPSEDPLSDLIQRELEHHFETEIKPFILQDFGQKENRTVPQHQNLGTVSRSNSGEFAPVEAEEYIFINIIEEFVKSEYPSLMRKMAVCTCNKCKNDVIALALNHLPSKYVVTRKGYLLSKLLTYEKQYKTDVLTAITNACIQVKAVPHHHS